MTISSSITHIVRIFDKLKFASIIKWFCIGNTKYQSVECEAGKNSEEESVKYDREHCDTEPCKDLKVILDDFTSQITEALCINFF